MIRVWFTDNFIKQIFIGGLIGGIFFAFPVYAQDFYGQSYTQLDRTQTVTERVHPDYEPLGIHHGSFILNPSIGMDAFYSDNILATQNNRVDDFITVLNPALRLQTLPSTRHDLIIDLSSKHGFYTSNTSENYTDYTARVAPRLNITRSLWLDGDFAFEHIHEDRTSPNVAQTLAEPLEYNRTYARVSGTYKPGLMAVTVGGTWDSYSYDNTAQIGGGQVMQDDRDRNEYRVHGELAYEFRPHYEAFIRTGINTISYKRNDFVVGPNTYTGNNRDSNGFDVLAGVRFDLTSIMRADIGVGYLSQRYDQAGLANINGVNLHGDVAWNMTQLTTVNLGLDRKVQETVSTGSSGYLETSMGIGIDHELRRNIILSASTQYAVQDYKGTGQKDDVVNFTTRGTYKMNRNIKWVLEYLYDQRDSNLPNLDFDRNIIMLRIKFKL